MMSGGKKGSLIVLIAVAIGIYYRLGKSKPEGATVTVSNGKLKGSIGVSRSGRNYYEFLGIPYAEPPVGQLRFEPPRPYKAKWEGVYDAAEFRQPCLQLSLLTHLRRGSEDCLFLNVYTPKLTKPALAVLVFFYGGLFMEGQSNMYGGKYFMDEDIVLVTLNYRIGALGFLNTYDGAIRGNMGLKDQNMALQWIQENIGEFNGDPTKVTIFGISAGSAAVHYHIISPLSKGLFSRAISQSGVSLNPWAYFPDPARQARRYAKNLGCPADDDGTREMVSCLKALPGDNLIDGHKEALDITREPITVFVPTVESVVDDKTFLPKSPHELVRNGSHINKVPWLTGLVSEEGLIASAMLLRNSTLWNMEIDLWRKLTPFALYYDLDDDVTSAIGNHYIPGFMESGRRDDEVFKNLTNLFSDRHFHKGIHDAALIHAEHAPVYLYYFTHATQFSLQDILLAVKGIFPAIVEIATTLILSWFKKTIFGIPPARYGVCHADEVHLFFNIGPHDAVGVNHVDHLISSNLVKLWVSFANGHTNLEYLGTTWLPIDKRNPRYLEIGSQQARLIEPPNLKRLEFWNTIKI